jgi:nucleotide sugar dehydrogenase
MIAIVGLGVVGKSVYKSIEKSTDEIIVVDPGKGYLGPKDFPSHNVDMIFICVPTPTKGSRQDLSIITKIVYQLMTAAYDGLVVIKSTILPSYAGYLQKAPMRIIHSPEFLDQSRPYETQHKHIVGMNEMAVPQCAEYEALFANPEILSDQFFFTDLKTAAMIKYVHNVHGALKVAFFNEIFDICGFEKVDYREMINGLTWHNDHVGKTYTSIGLDGKRGFGGFCFPKDILAMNAEYKSKMMQAAIDCNKEFNRKEMIDCMEQLIEEDDCGNINSIVLEPTKPRKSSIWPYGDM